MDFTELTPTIVTLAPAGGLVAVDKLGDATGCFGDEDMRIAVGQKGVPTVCHQTERPLSHWIAEQTDPGMFEVLGTWVNEGNIEQGTIATGSLTNYLLLTDSHLRGSIPWFRSKLRTPNGVNEIPHGSVYSFAIPLIEILSINGNKNGIAVATNLAGVLAKWVRSADANWGKTGSRNPWHKDNIPFGQAVLAATIAARQAHPDEKVQASAAQMRHVDTSQAFAARNQTDFEFPALT